MNKIYSEPVAKAQALMEGVKKQQELLAKKGITVDAAALAEACAALEEAGRQQDAAEEQLKAARAEAHARLSTLKELYSAAKLPIKQEFAPEVWWSFGLSDKK